MGDTLATLAAARNLLDAAEGVRVDALSSVYRTEPQGDVDQPWFLNQVARLRCEAHVTPEDLLLVLQATENRLGRVRDPARRFGPRPIDLDVLLFDSAVWSTKNLEIPHPRMRERAFVLVPLHEIEPDLVLPGGETIRDLLSALDYSITGDAIYQPARP